MGKLDEPEVPDRYRVLGVLLLVNGIIDMTIGWFAAMYVWAFVGTLCSTMLTCGMCPIGMFCGALPLLMIPIAILETVAGILILSDPRQSRPFMRWLPYLQISAFFLGDIVSPIVGLVTYMTLQDPDVAGYLDEPRF